jgi:isopentenyldiphosphate isomerase
MPRLRHGNRRPSQILALVIVAAFALLFSGPLPHARQEGIRGLQKSPVPRLSKHPGEAPELLLVYRFRSGFAEPPHLTPVDIEDALVPLRQNGGAALLPIDQVHLQGLVHTGAWLYVLDNTNRILVMKRGPQLVTCPSMWSLVGEHTLGNEAANTTAFRAIEEELGPELLSYIEFIQPLATLPVYYFREYGPSNGNRVDRQVTWQWRIQLNQSSDQLPLKVDDEVAEFRWLTLPELSTWVEEAEQAVLHSRPLEKLCHHTIVSLCRTGLDQLADLLDRKVTKAP